MSTPQDPQRPYDPAAGSAPQTPVTPPQQPAGFDPTAQPGFDPNARPGFDPNARPGFDPNAQQPSLGQASGDPYGSAGSTGPGYGAGPQTERGAFQQGVPAGFQPAPPTPPTNNKNRNIIIAAVVVLAVVAVGLFVWQSQKKDTTKAAVGACINVIEASATAAKTEQIDCADPKASYMVTETGKGATCDDNEATYSEGDVNVCLRPNLKVGECASESDNKLVKVDCAVAKGDDVKVVGLDTTSSDGSKCTKGQAFPLTKRHIVYCLDLAKS